MNQDKILFELKNKKKSVTGAIVKRSFSETQNVQAKGIEPGPAPKGLEPKGIEKFEPKGDPAPKGIEPKLDPKAEPAPKGIEPKIDPKIEPAPKAEPAPKLEPSK